MVVKAALAVIANERFGGTERPEGICKYQGGVMVNGREIWISRNFVQDNNRSYGDPSPEEQAVVAAIEEVASTIKPSGLARFRRGSGATALKGQYGECHFGDPLRDLVDGGP